MNSTHSRHVQRGYQSDTSAPAVGGLLGGALPPSARKKHYWGPVSLVPVTITPVAQSETDHCAIVPWHRRPFPLRQTQAPPSKKWNVLRALPPGNVVKCFVHLVVTVKTCVLRATAEKKKKSLQLFCILEFPPPEKIMGAPITAADGTAPITLPVRLCCRLWQYRRTECTESCSTVNNKRRLLTRSLRLYVALLKPMSNWT